MPFYAVYRRGWTTAKAVPTLEAAFTEAGKLSVSQMEAAIRALEDVRERPDFTRKLVRRPGYKYEYRIDDLLIMKVHVDWRPGMALLLVSGYPGRTFESRLLGLFQVMKEYLEIREHWRPVLAAWLGLVEAGLPNDLLTYLLERRGLAVHWIEERVRCQIDYELINLVS